VPPRTNSASHSVAASAALPTPQAPQIELAVMMCSCRFRSEPGWVHQHVRSFFGIPSHPLFVHIPAVLLPLAALGVVFMVIRPAWHQRYRWAVLAVGFVGAVGAVLAAGAGEDLESQIVAKEGRGAAASWEDHASAGETARLFALVFLVILAAYILVPWFAERRTAQGRPLSLPGWIRGVSVVLVLAASVGTVVTVILAGHSGAKSVWCGVNTPPNCPADG
jgi:hypothetical protein